MTVVVPGHEPLHQAVPRRTAFGAAALVSAVLFLLVASFWVRSWWAADFFWYKRGRVLEPGFSHFSLDSVQRSIHVGYYWTPSLPKGEVTGFTWEAMPSRNVRVFNDHWGFGAAGSEIWFPHLLLMFLLAILPMNWILWCRRMRRRLLRNLCVRCGYDLRATPDGCPECGTHAASRRASPRPAADAPA